MTTAVCIHCGSFKFGAFNPCDHCGSVPVTEEDYALSFALTEHFNSEEELQKIGEQIASGIRLRIGPDSLPPDMQEIARDAKAACEKMAAFVKKKRRKC
ncbi:hypothetical protein CfE428DRAFT_4197 [Chthoniobacter flavus Ellin428]|uniref:Uncharacterized protein n=1 Tax=Chthoniobacter flavus Ellin428 TaxID=497964 RepID=B4D5K8_9BACT|nr:hypothetical protein [Chthoniobacter flavus]EDY18413.1 hypothetical protein CfE428DRAFT_4197 [Chthoniobacter flavus Ellin428]TCO90879.1 hypothetical protein EV701_10928 [Chthoniobacter flavus]